jgi:hypothetical protein
MLTVVVFVVGAEQSVVCVLVYVCLDTLLGLDVRRGFYLGGCVPPRVVFCLRILFA